MALMYAKYPDPEPIRKAVKLVIDRQLPVSLAHNNGGLQKLIHGAGWLVATGGDRRGV
jgi:hypothetical protein